MIEDLKRCSTEYGYGRNTPTQNVFRGERCRILRLPVSNMATSENMCCYLADGWKPGADCGSCIHLGNSGDRSRSRGGCRASSQNNVIHKIPCFTIMAVNSQLGSNTCGSVAATL